MPQILDCVNYGYACGVEAKPVMPLPHEVAEKSRVTGASDVTTLKKNTKHYPPNISVAISSLSAAVVSYGSVVVSVEILDDRVKVAVKISRN